MCFIKSNVISLLLKYLLKGGSKQVITSVFIAEQTFRENSMLTTMLYSKLS